MYFLQGAISISDIELKNCTPQKDRPVKDDIHNPYLWTTEDIPTWANIIKHNKVFKVSFDMLDDMPNALRKALDIGQSMSRLVKFYKKKWYTSDSDGSFHLYGAFNNGHSSNTSQRKISVLGLVLTFNEADGSLVLSESDFDASKRFFPTLDKEMRGAQLARVEMPSEKSVKRATTPPQSVQPCQVQWSNALRFDPTDSKGKCLHFTASTAGTLFVVFAALPKDVNSRYSVEISPERVATYKVITVVNRSVGDTLLS